jgi:hypothetical protein
MGVAASAGVSEIDFLHPAAAVKAIKTILARISSCLKVDLKTNLEVFTPSLSV